MIGGQGDITSTVVWFLMFFALMFLYPRLMLTQVIVKLEKSALKLETMAIDSRKKVEKLTNTTRAKSNIKNFMDFFAVPPVSTDPYGVMKKLDHMIKNSDRRINSFVDQVVPNLNKEEKQNFKYGLIGAVTTHQIAKVVRHFLETIKKYKMFQLAVLIQMQLPMIEEIAEASVEATSAFLKQQPIGDSIGPLVAAKMIKGKTKSYVNGSFVSYKTKIQGRTVFIAKVSGPGPDISHPGKFVQEFMNKNKINKMITIDASQKMEGEKTGSVCEGIGVVMNPSGTDRFEIEEIVTKKNIPLDGVAIKMGNKEALMPMKVDIMKSIPQVMDYVNDSIKRSKKSDKILIIGVGNTCGVGNDYKAALIAEKIIRKVDKKRIEKEKTKKKGLFKKF